MLLTRTLAPNRCHQCHRLDPNHHHRLNDLLHHPNHKSLVQLILCLQIFFRFFQTIIRLIRRSHVLDHGSSTRWSYCHTVKQRNRQDVIGKQHVVHIILTSRCISCSYSWSMIGLLFVCLKQQLSKMKAATMCIVALSIIASLVTVMGQSVNHTYIVGLQDTTGSNLLARRVWSYYH